MKRVINKELVTKKLERYCVNVMKMYNYGRVNVPV